jgi:hypothetical protein
MQVDPRVPFWLGIAITVLVGVGGGTVRLTNVVPEAWIPAVVAWNNLLGFIGTAVMTALVGVSSSANGPLIRKPPGPPDGSAK